MNHKTNETNVENAGREKLGDPSVFTKMIRKNYGK